MTQKCPLSVTELQIKICGCEYILEWVESSYSQHDDTLRNVRCLCNTAVCSSSLKKVKYGGLMTIIFNWLFFLFHNVDNKCTVFNNICLGCLIHVKVLHKALHRLLSFHFLSCNRI